MPWTSWSIGDERGRAALAVRRLRIGLDHCVDGTEQLWLALEVVVHGALRDPSVTRDVVDGRRVVPLRPEQPPRRCEDRGTGGHDLVRPK